MNSTPRLPKPQPQKPPDTAPPLSLQQRYDRAAAEYQKWIKVAAAPGLSPQAAHAARELSRSAKASMQLGQKALDYAEPASDPEVEKNLNLYRLLQLPLPISVPTQTPNGSPEKGTSASRT